LALVVIGGAVTLWNSASSNIVINDTQKEIMAIQSNTRALFGGRSNFTDLTNSLAVESELALNNMYDGSVDGIFNQYDGPVILRVNAGSTRFFDIQYGRIPEPSCISLASLEGDWISVLVNGVAVDGPAAAALNCIDGDNIIVWTSS
jgi:hypothetical protein